MQCDVGGFTTRRQCIIQLGFLFLASLVRIQTTDPRSLLHWIRIVLMLLVHPALQRPGGEGRAFASSSSSRPVESDMHASPITAAQALQLQGHMQPSSILHAFGIPLHGLDFRCCALGPKNTVIVGSGSPCCRGDKTKSRTPQNQHLHHTALQTSIHPLRGGAATRCDVQDVHQEALFLATLQTREEGAPAALSYLVGARDSHG